MAKKRRERKPSKDSLSLSEKPIQRNAANARERARMRVLSRAFGRLKTSLPWVPPDTKLSKLDTLRLASTYIAHLLKILQSENNESTDSSASSHPTVLTWPFSIHNRPDATEDIVCRPRSQDVDNYGYSDFASCDIIAPNSRHDTHSFSKTMMGHCLQ